MRGTLLALDTSGSRGSVALRRGGEIVAASLIESRAEHAARLVPTIDGVLRRAGLAPAAIDGIVVGEGPGSFTGVRIAAATGKGMAHALSVPLWGVSSLAATALTGPDAPTVYALFDARSERVYGACYACRPEAWRTLVPPHAGDLDAVLAAAIPAGTVFTGDGAEKHRARLEEAGREVRAGTGEGLAVGLLRYLDREPDAEPLAEPGAWEPAYLRPWSPGAP